MGETMKKTAAIGSSSAAAFVSPVKTAVQRQVAWLAGFAARVFFAHRHALAVGVEQYFVCIKAQTVARIDRSVGAIGIYLAGLQPRHQDVPVMEGVVGFGVELDDTRGLGIIHIIEQQQLNAGAAAGVYAEIYALGRKGGAERIRLAG